MGFYAILCWQDIPNVVRAWDEQGEAKTQLSPRFSLAIDAIATAEGEKDAGVYLDSWHWGTEASRAGTPTEITQALVDELEAAWPRDRLEASVQAASSSKKRR